MTELTVRGATVLTPAGPARADIAVDGGRITAMAATLAPGARDVDATGLLVLPGLVDIHVHFREPGMTEKEDFATGTDAAAAGGVTTVFDMPNTVPATATGELLDAKRALVEGKARVDFGLYGLFSEQIVERVAGLAAAGVAGLKLFMGQTTGDNVCPEDDVVLEGLTAAAAHGLLVGVHAENERARRVLAARLVAEGRTDPAAHLASRPATIEAEAVARICRLARLAGARIHIHHLSSAEGLDEVERARRLGTEVSCEALVGHLLLDESAYATLGNLVKLNPPIRPATDVAALWAGMRRGAIDAIATDHAPHEPAGQAEPDVWRATAGFIGVETMLPLLLTEVDRGRLGLAELVERCCRRPAHLLGVGDRKGALAVGHDADLVLVDPTAAGQVNGAGLHSRHPVTPYEGWSTMGAVVSTYVRGTAVFEEGHLTPERPGNLTVPVRRPAVVVRPAVMGAGV